MPRIFDNIDNALLPELSKVLSVSERADFCVGYFNLRGWRKIDQHIEGWSGRDGNACRLLVGMHKSPEKGLREKLATAFHDDGIDNARALELKKEWTLGRACVGMVHDGKLLLVGSISVGSGSTGSCVWIYIIMLPDAPPTHNVNLLSLLAKIWAHSHTL